MAALSLPTVNGFVVNGKAYPAAAPLSVTQGQRVRLRLINAGLAGTQKLALAGHHFTLTHSDGNPLAAPVEAEAVLLGPGERADVEFTADNPGRWQLRSLTPGQAEAGLITEVVYTGHEADPVQGFAPGADPQPASYRQFGGPAHRGTPDRTYQITLAYSMNDGAYTFNGKAYPDAEAIQAQVGQRVRVRILNMNLEDHPIHLHGHSFQVVGIEDQPVDGPIKDTLTLHHGEQYDIEFVANNPGTWLLHCHNVLHMAAGMMTEVHYQ
jgi:FtsP/CotA-like multicopper oxidase with cupredoxin domain